LRQTCRGQRHEALGSLPPVKDKAMRESENSQKTLQGLLDCYLETRPDEVLRSWADNGWAPDPLATIDETCLKYITLVLLDSIESRAEKTILEMGCPALVDSGSEQHMLPPAPESMLARGLELLREMCGLEAAQGDGLLYLGIRNDSIELRLHKSEAPHIIYFPKW
jgi:hypothetical protein